MSSEHFIAELFDEFVATLRPLAAGLSGPRSFAALLSELGWSAPTEASLDSVAPTFAAVGQSVNALDGAASAVRTAIDGGGSAADVATALEGLITSIGKVIRELRALEQADFAALVSPFNEPTFWQSGEEGPSFPEEIVGYLIYRRIEERLPVLFGVLRVLGVLDGREVQPTTPGRVPYERRTVNWDRLPSLVAEPGSLPATVYGWGSDFDHRLLVANLQALLAAFGGRPAATSDDPALDDYLDPDVPGRDEIRALRALLVWTPFDDGETVGVARLEFVVVPIPPVGDRKAKPVGVALFPEVSAQFGTSIPLSPAVTIEVRGGFSASIVRAEIRPGGTSVAIWPPSGEGSGEITLLARPPSPWVILGTQASSRIELSEAHVSLLARADASGLEYQVAAGADATRLVLDFAEGDGFLQKLFGGSPQTVDLSLSVTWSSRTGFRFSGRGEFEILIPVHQSILEVVFVETIHISLAAESSQGAAALTVALTGSAELGPVIASVKEVGLRLKLISVPKEAPPGNFGPLDIAFGFKPPVAVGIAVDAESVAGGGYLDIDEENDQYAGILHLAFSEIALTAVGLLTTRMPGGSPGFSLVALIGVKFDPAYALGYGFFLKGVGGLIGVNRTMDLDAIQAGVRTGAVDSILFPEDPIGNAPKIISDLRTIFPPEEGRYVIGPMAIITWGVPTIIEAQIAILIELPAPIRLAILGQLLAILPNPDKNLVQLRMDVAGLVDFAKQTLSVDASLYDSHLLSYPLTGEMALRSSWGDDAYFALAVGGGRPDYKFPPGFPILRRVRVSIGDGDNPRLNLDSYFALTENTAQFGARLELQARMSKFDVYGLLGFDTFLEFSPFSFVAEIYASVDLRLDGSSLMSVKLDFLLTGPAPWRARGKAKFKIAFVKFRVGFDKPFGRSVETVLPPIDPWASLTAAIDDPANWVTVLPLRKQLPVAVHDALPAAAPAEEAGPPVVPPLVVDPAGELVVKQKVVPLAVQITRFGKARPPAPVTFDLAAVGEGLSVAAEPEEFAPGDFWDRPKSQLLNARYETHKGGVRIAGAVVDYAGPVIMDVLYEEVQDPEIPDQPTVPQRLPRDLGIVAAALSEAAKAERASARLGGLGVRQPESKVRISEPGFVVATTSDVTVVPEFSPDGPLTRTAAEALLSEDLRLHPDHRGRLQVVPQEEGVLA